MNETALDDKLDRARVQRGLPDPTLRRVLRRHAGLTQADVADVLGVERASVTRYESGTREPRGQLRADYAALLDRLAKERA